MATVTKTPNHVDSPYQVFPDLTPDEFEVLKQDISERGVQVAIEVTERGEVLDGHQRLRACRELGIRNYPLRIISGLDEDGKRHHAIKANCLRRHLTRQQKKDLVVAELRRNPRQSNRLLAELIGVDDKTVAVYRRELEGTAEIPQLESFVGKNGKTYRAPSMIVHSPSAARKAQGLLMELGEDAPVGRSLSPREASTLLNIKRRERADTKVEEGPLPRAVQVYQGAFQQVGKRIKDESVDLIYTDPPYGQSFVDQWGDLGAFAARVLRPGSLLVTYTGQTHLGEVIAALSEHLSYVWCMAVAHAQRQNRIHHKRVVNSWKPLLVFGRGTSRFPETVWDLFQGNGADKDHHDWAQGLDEAIHFIEALVPAGSLVCDPCLGSGTTGMAAIRCGMRFVGIEVEERTCQAAKARLAREAKEGRS